MRGVSAFHPSDQSHGTIANSVLTAPSSSTVIAISGGMGPSGTGTLPIALNLNNILVYDQPDSSNNDNSIPPSTTVQPSSMIFPTVSKHKHSVLSDDAASVSSYASKQSRSSTSSGVSVSAMHGMSSSIHNGSLGVGQPCHHRRSSAERRIEATTLLQQKEDLTVDQIIAFADLFEQNMSKADTYMALIRDDVRKFWVQKQLVELGFPIVTSSSEV